MAPPTPKENYMRMYKKLQEQYRGVESGATSRVTAAQLDKLAELQDIWAAELGLMHYAAGGTPLRQAEAMLEEVERREIAVAKREARAGELEMKYEQQEALLESFREEI